MYKKALKLNLVSLNSFTNLRKINDDEKMYIRFDSFKNNT